jgi:hypothetical protein
VADLERRISELRFIEGIEKVEHVPYPNGDQFWIRFNQPIDLERLEDVVKKHGYKMMKFATFPSKLPRGVGQLLWDGVTHIIVKKISSWSEFTSKLGFEPEGIAKLASDSHGPYQIFMATEEQGIQLLYEYLGLKYVPPAPPQPPPKPAVPAKTATPAASKPSPPATQQPAPATKTPPTTPSPSAQTQQPTSSAVPQSPTTPSRQ